MTFVAGWSLASPAAPRVNVALPEHIDASQVVACVPTLAPAPDPRTVKSIRALGVDRIAVAVDHERRGAAWARNRAASMANGTWLLFVDDGVVVTPSMLASAQRVIESGQPVAAITGDVNFQGSPISPWYNSHRTLVPPMSPGGDPATLVTAAVLVSAGAFRAVGGFDEDFPSAAGEDFDLGFRLLGAGSIRHAAVPWAVHCEDMDSSAATRAFVGRFKRYGRGWRILATKWGLGPPSEIQPIEPRTPLDSWLSRVANRAFQAGLVSEDVGECQ